MLIELKLNTLLSIFKQNYNINDDLFYVKSRGRDISEAKNIIIYILRIEENEEIKDIQNLLDIEYNDVLNYTIKYISLIKSDLQFKEKAKAVLENYKTAIENSIKNPKKYNINYSYSQVGYQFSTNYLKLWELLHKGYKVIFYMLDNQSNLTWRVNDIFWNKIEKYTDPYNISSLTTFEDFCQKHCVHYIMPKLL